MAVIQYTHACPYVYTVRDLVGLLSAAWVLDRAALAATGDDALAADLTALIPKLELHINALRGMNQSLSPAAAGIVIDDYCELVRNAWTYASVVSLAKGTNLEQALARFDAANTAAASGTVPPPAELPAITPHGMSTGTRVLAVVASVVIVVGAAVAIVKISAPPRYRRHPSTR